MPDEIPLQIAAEMIDFRSYSTKRSIKLSFETQEAFPPETMARFLAMQKQTGWLLFMPGERQIASETVANLPEPPVVEKGRKSPSMRLRNTLWRVWDSKGRPNPSGAKSQEKAFDFWYEDFMEKIIDHYKTEIEY